MAACALMSRNHLSDAPGDGPSRDDNHAETSTFDVVTRLFETYCDADPSYSAQMTVYVGGERVVDTARGLSTDALIPVYSSSKGASAIVISLLVQRNQLDLDETVATYWPEFAQAGKGMITVRQLLSHQAGLLGVDGGFSWEELMAHTRLAERLAAQRPFWQPGRAFMYHAVTIGTLADELVRRVDGRTLAQVLREDVTGPRRIDVWMGTPESEDGRVVEALPPSSEELNAYLAESPDALARSDGLSARSLPAGGALTMLNTVNEVAMRRAGAPAVGVLASGRGLAALYAALRHEVNGCPRVLTEDTIGQMSQIQVAGCEMGTGLPARFGVLFQVPCPPRWPFGTPGAFGHDGAGGSQAFCDPSIDVAFGYTVQRLPLPGGNKRALELAGLVRQCIGRGSS
jgi:CubicO group peptidase (beta-lactamase class C family)